MATVNYDLTAGVTPNPFSANNWGPASLSIQQNGSAPTSPAAPPNPGGSAEVVLETTYSLGGNSGTISYLSGGVPFADFFNPGLIPQALTNGLPIRNPLMQATHILLDDVLDIEGQQQPLLALNVAPVLAGVAVGSLCFYKWE
jgi:hypothetical protein